jgi:hypothetical protein
MVESKEPTHKIIVANSISIFPISPNFSWINSSEMRKTKGYRRTLLEPLPRKPEMRQRVSNSSSAKCRLSFGAYRKQLKSSCLVTGDREEQTIETMTRVRVADSLVPASGTNSFKSFQIKTDSSLLGTLVNKDFQIANSSSSQAWEQLRRRCEVIGFRMRIPEDFCQMDRVEQRICKCIGSFNLLVFKGGKGYYI